MNMKRNFVPRALFLLRRCSPSRMLNTKTIFHKNVIVVKLILMCENCYAYLVLIVLLVLGQTIVII